MDLRDAKKRFVSDGDLRIPVLEEPYWSFFMNLYGYKEKWDKFLEDTEADKNGHFLNNFYQTREKILQGIKEDEKWKAFVQDKDGMKAFDVPVYPNVSKDSIYNESWVGGTYISLDLKKANFQAFQYIRGIKCEDLDQEYHDWIESFSKDDKVLTEYVAESKYIRQVVFGNNDPKRQIKVEKWLIHEAYQTIKDKLEGDMIMFGSDEIIVKGSSKVPCHELEQTIKNTIGITVKVEEFVLDSIPFQLPSSNQFRVYVKKYSDGTKKFKGIPTQYRAQVYELLNGIEPDPEGRDLVFYYDKEEIATFKGRICLAVK